MRKKTKENLKNQRLGDILKSLNLLDDKTLEQLLERQRHSNLKFGEVLSLMGCVDQEIVLSILGKQLGHPYVKVSEHCPLDMEVLKDIP
ncbi:MAG: hypothetical protein GX817_03665 [Elusimicrobia bacterium]|nr:hypothetical protein [Elusimicrobiota bacterium]